MKDQKNRLQKNRVQKLRFNLDRDRGFGLIEVLVSLAIIGIGFLAIAGLNNSYRLIQDSQAKLEASYLAEDMANRMKMNWLETIKGIPSIYNDPNHVKAADSDLGCGLPTSRACTNIEMAQYDLWQLYNKARTTLPNGALKVCLDSRGDGSCNGTLSNYGMTLYSITVTWDTKDGRNATFLTSVNP